MWKRFLCSIGLHRWTSWRKIECHHYGETSFETWHHLCYANIRTCLDCNWDSDLQKPCQGPIKPLPDRCH